jgi:hypothetical protein
MLPSEKMTSAGPITARSSQVVRWSFVRVVCKPAGVDSAGVRISQAAVPPDEITDAGMLKIPAGRASTLVAKASHAIDREKKANFIATTIQKLLRFSKPFFGAVL